MKQIKSETNKEEFIRDVWQDILLSILNFFHLSVRAWQQNLNSAKLQSVSVHDMFKINIQQQKNWSAFLNHSNVDPGQNLNIGLVLMLFSVCLWFLKNFSGIASHANHWTCQFVSFVCSFICLLIHSFIPSCRNSFRKSE